MCDREIETNLLGNKMWLAGTMDLNEPPPEFDYDFLDGVNATPFYGIQDGVNANPSYCTQRDLVLTLQEKNHVEQQHVGGTLIARSGTQNANTCAITIQEAATVTDGVVEQLVEGVLEGVVEELVEDVWLTPPVPYTGQTFCSKQEARKFYNSYARRIGFSIRTSTTHLSSLTREQNKVQFVCNKEGRGRKQKEEQGAASSEESNYDEEDSEPDDDNDGSVKKKKLDGGRKRKREKMQHTDCKARMVIKLIADRWHVIYFAPDHNHDLVVKPSLKKFLRSHNGIPKEEKDFIALLHGCNLSTGRIMQLMNEFYGFAQLVPYEWLLLLLRLVC